MSKKFILKRSYAEAVHGCLEEYVCGESVIKAKYGGFPYRKTTSTTKKDTPPTPEKKTKLVISADATSPQKGQRSPKQAAETVSSQKGAGSPQKSARSCERYPFLSQKLHLRQKGAENVYIHVRYFKEELA